MYDRRLGGYSDWRRSRAKRGLWSGPAAASEPNRQGGVPRLLSQGRAFPIVLAGKVPSYADGRITNDATRLLELMAQPEEIQLLAPLVIDEILIRLLRGPVGAQVAQIGLTESGMHGVANAIAWLRVHFSRPMKVGELARLAHMSVSSFHQHFRSVTSLSPLQYQKALRLQEARRLMLSERMDAGAAGRHVGYASPSQFTRDYQRFFGSAPTKDIARLRQADRET